MNSIFDQFAGLHFEAVYADTKAVARFEDGSEIPCIIDAFDVENRIEQSLTEATVRFRKQDIGDLIQIGKGRQSLRHVTFSVERNGNLVKYEAKTILSVDAYSVTLLCLSSLKQ